MFDFDPKARPISRDEARRIALKWSLDEGIDNVRALKFADAVWAKANEHAGISAADLLTHLRYFEKARNETVFAWREYELSEDQRRDSWILETVKHIAIANGAGVAGATALLAGRGETTMATCSVVAFSIGLLAAVVDFALNAIAHQRRAEHSRDRIKSARAAASWEEIIDNETDGSTKNRSEPGDTLSTWAARCGIFGVVCALVGIVFLALSAARSAPALAHGPTGPAHQETVTREYIPAARSPDLPIEQHLFPAAHIVRHTTQ